jgi:predicted PurR-regulated permease PerM
MEDGVLYAESTLKPVISDEIDELTRRTQNIALEKLMNNKLAALKQAGEDLKTSVNEKVDNLMIQASEKRPDPDDANYDEQIKIYNNWLGQITDGIKKVQSFFERIWTKVRELLDKVFKWIRDGVTNLSEKISSAFRIIKTTLFRE